MAKKARQRISYVVELPKSSAGHRLGVNGLAVDRDNGILYSGGRDGIVCSWDLNLDLKSSPSDTVPAAAGSKPKSTTTFRSQTQAHMHWINDIVLAQNKTALVSASSDLTVKLWRPHSEEQADPQTIGEHADYVKCVTTLPDGSANWVATGGLDRKICVWDLNGGGKTLEIDTTGEETQEKGSIYALAAGNGIIASGGPASTVRLWDPRTGTRIKKFVGHTGNIRAILLNEACDTVLTASSDQTVKVWSVTAGRCMYTMTMHNDSVWSLYAEDRDLGVFYSSDRLGLVVKTDVRGSLGGDLDDGLSLAVAQENDGVVKTVVAGNYIWTATSRSSINRWANVDTGADIQLPEAFRHQRAASTGSLRMRQASVPSTANPAKKEIPAKSILRISNTASFPSQLLDSESATVGAGSLARKGSEIIDNTISVVEPVHHLPEETIEGQFGLVKHKLLNDRRRVLTLDTAGDVLLWDLIKCVPIQSFGKRHLEDVEPEVNTLEAVAPWCSIDTSSGSLTVVLETFNCFDAEMYADELVTEEPVDFRDDQRINLGKWILRYLFAGFIDEQIRRDEAYRQKINENVEKRAAAAARAKPPSNIDLPPLTTSGWDGTESAETPRANGSQYPPTTPGFAIALATPGPSTLVGPEGAGTPSTPLDKRLSQVSRPSVDKDDYFGGAIAPVEGAGKPAVTPATPAPEPAAEVKPPAAEGSKDKEKDKDAANGKSPNTPFTKKFRMGMSFGAKKLGRSASTNAEKPAVVDEKAEESESSSSHEKEVDDSALGVIQKIRNEYEKQLAENPDKLVETRIAPSLPNDTPVLKLPSGTKVVLQEETTGGSANIYQGTVASVGKDADNIEAAGPMWLGEVLLLNQVPQKDPVKVSFVLHPWQDSLPSITTADGNNRLNANRMLRVKKILAYVAERIDPQPENPEPDALRPDEYLELYCNDQLLPNTMSLATLRAHVWKGGNDIILYYKANGRKEIPIPTEPKPEVAEEAGSATAAA